MGFIGYRARDRRRRPCDGHCCGGDDQAAGLIAVRDEIEEHVRFLLALFGVTEINEDDHRVFVELVQRIFQTQLLVGELQLLDQGGGGEIAHTHTVLGQAVTDGGGQMGLAHTAGAEQPPSRLNVEQIDAPLILYRRRRFRRIRRF